MESGGVKAPTLIGDKGEWTTRCYDDVSIRELVCACVFEAVNISHPL